MPTNTVRANARTLPKAKPVATTGSERNPVSNPADPLAFLPDRYALTVSGHCLAPEINEGDVLTFDKTEPYKPGDLVVVFRRPTDGARFRAEVKRLVMGPPSWVKSWSDKPDSDIAPLVVLEMNNPPRRFALRCADILGIHRCVGLAAQGTAGRASACRLG